MSPKSMMSLLKRRDVVDDYASGMPIEAICASRKMTRSAVLNYIKTTIETLKTLMVESAGDLVAMEWAKLDRLERDISEMLADLRDETPVNIRSVGKLLDNADRIVSRRIDLLKLMNPGEDRSTESNMVLVVVKDRESLGDIVDALEFVKHVDKPTEPVPNEPPQEADESGNADPDVRQAASVRPVDGAD